MAGASPSRFPDASISLDADPRARRLVEAAYELLDDAGLEGLTIRAVLIRTGLARRAFYDNFSGKDDLLLAVFEQTVRRAAIHYRQMTAGLSSPMDRLAMIVTSIASGAIELDGSGAPEPPAEPGSAAIHRRSAAMSREHLRLAESRPRELHAALAPLHRLFVEQLRAGMAVGEMRADDPELQAALIYNLVSTTAHTELLAAEGEAPDHDRRRQLARAVWQFCRLAIAT